MSHESRIAYYTAMLDQLLTPGERYVVTQMLRALSGEKP